MREILRYTMRLIKYFTKWHSIGIAIYRTDQGPGEGQDEHIWKVLLLESAMRKRTDAKFNVGQIIQHRDRGYRGVIVDVDPIFYGSDDWYERNAHTRPPKDEPWYHVLVDNEEQNTYVSEQSLQEDSSSKNVNHPLLEEFFESFQNGRYIKSWREH